MQRELCFWFSFVLLVSSISSFAFGLMDVHVKEGCTYQSIVSRINIPYIIGCEFGRPRWGEIK